MLKIFFQKLKDFVIKYRIVAITIVIISLFLLPWLLDLLIFGNSLPSALSNGEWASFLGSYLGGVLGGICTLTTVIVTVRQNQKQMLKAEEEKLEAQREKLEEEKRRRHSRIVSETIDFISDVQIWEDFKERNRNHIDKLAAESGEWETLKCYYDRDRGEKRYGNSWNTLDQLLYTEKVDTSIVDRYRRNCVDDHVKNTFVFSNMDYSYEKFEDYLNDNISKLQEEIDALYEQLEEKKRQMIIGNLHYLFLETTLRGDDKYSGLINLVCELQEKAEKEYTWPLLLFGGKYCSNRQDSIQECIDKIKNELRK